MTKCPPSPLKLRLFAFPFPHRNCYQRGLGLGRIGKTRENYNVAFFCSLPIKVEGKINWITLGCENIQSPRSLFSTKHPSWGVSERQEERGGDVLGFWLKEAVFWESQLLWGALALHGPIHLVISSDSICFCLWLGAPRHFQKVQAFHWYCGSATLPRTAAKELGESMWQSILHSMLKTMLPCLASVTQQ